MELFIIMCLELKNSSVCFVFRNTAAQLKDRHDSSTEEETETKADLARIADGLKMEFDDVKSSSIKDGMWRVSSLCSCLRN